MKTEKITQFTNANLDLLREKVEAALAVVGEKYNVKFDLGRITYSPTDSTASAKLKFEAKTADGKQADHARLDWDKYSKIFGLKPEWIDQTFRSKEGDNYKITGLNPKKRRFPVETIRVSDGKIFGWPSEAVPWLIDPKGVAREAWNSAAKAGFLNRYNGLQPEWLNQTFKLKGPLEFKVEGLDYRQSTPIVISYRDKDAVTTKFSYISVEDLLNAAGKAPQAKSQDEAKSAA
jgi:hypothetical protein